MYEASTVKRFLAATVTRFVTATVLRIPLEGGAPEILYKVRWTILNDESRIID